MARGFFDYSASRSGLNVYYDISTRRVFVSDRLDAGVVVVGSRFNIGRVLYLCVARHQIEKTYTRSGLYYQPFDFVITIKPIGEYARSANTGSIKYY